MLGFSARSALASVVLVGVLWSRPSAAQEAIPEEAKLYFKNGVELIQSQPPNYQDAYYQFKLAWEKSKSWKVLSNWGLCALKLERDGEAIWAYTEYLKQKDIDPEERKDLERDLLLLNGNAASVSVSSDVPDLEIVDARSGSSVPPQSYRLVSGKLDLRLRAGSHTITASSQGKSQRWEVTLSPGRTDQHLFDFAHGPASAQAAAPPPTAAPAAAPAPAPAAPAPASPAGSSESSGGTIRTVGYVVAGVGLVGVGVGAFLGVSAKGQESDVRGDKTKCQQVDVIGFVCSNSAKTELSSAADKAKLANVFLIGGSVLAASGLVMVLVGGPSHPETASLSLSPVLGPRDAGLLASGRF